ncbi:protein PAXX isoform X1 [Elephas maximus indicus]|uniref:protein PAXX isoform X1 n=1 Tax=Elephas maximus indicus TaxID=99487 RepID=UPI0021165AC7|nr:protein PAXX isoform X1 [Elephas maximus indicus]
MAPPPLSPPLCTLPAGPGPPRFVCYCEGEGAGDGDRGPFNIYVTDAAELWSTCFTPDHLPALKARFGLSAAEDIAPRFRAACEQQAVTLTLQEDLASLTLSSGPSTLTFDLSKLRRGQPAPGRAPYRQGCSSFYQTLILRGVALDLGSGDGVLESPSSTLASKVRNRPVVWTLMTPEGTAKSVTQPEIHLERRGSPLETRPPHGCPSAARPRGCPSSPFPTK